MSEENVEIVEQPKKTRIQHNFWTTTEFAELIKEYMLRTGVSKTDLFINAVSEYLKKD